MKPHVLLFLLTGILVACQPKDASQDLESTTEVNTSAEKPEVFNDSIIGPAGLTLLYEANGDLTKDEVPERVRVYDNGIEGEFGTAREIHIYRKGKTAWTLLEKIKGGVLPSEHGGMMGDPFIGVEIERGCIVLYHNGGSRWKWSYTHRFRLQNDRWELIGATIYDGAPCDQSETLDFNLSTGDIEIKKEKEACKEDEVTVENSVTIESFLQLDPLPELAGFYPGNNQLKLIPNDVFYY
ncbi:MAG: hypothetical protein AAF598_18915 [Bacteroidota bacterium]